MALTESTMMPLGTQAPDFELPEPLSGQTRSLNELRGEKAILIVFKKFKPLPIEKSDELFPNGIFEFNISKLVAFIKENSDGFSLESVEVKVLPAWASTNLNESTIEAADLSVPIILAEISPGMFNVIDGNHRLEKARRNGADTIPAYRAYARQYTAFLTSVDAYHLYIDYWNSKIPKEVRSKKNPKRNVVRGTLPLFTPPQTIHLSQRNFMIEEKMEYDSIEALISDAEKQGSQKTPLPKTIVDELSVHPERVIQCLQYLTYHDPLPTARMHSVFLLIEEGLSQVRYSLDRKEQKGKMLLSNVEDIINRILPSLSNTVKIGLNQIIYDTKLPIEINETVWNQEASNAQESTPDIMPRLPELLDQLRRQKNFKTAFELYDLLLPQLQIIPIQVQLGLIGELAHSKKPIVHEVAVLMLLHKKADVRKHVAKLLYHLSSEEVFTPIDLRRLIMIRNWVPQAEREDIDDLIEHLRRNKLNPAPCLSSKKAKIVGSCMDGAGAVIIMMETKINNQRKIAGFLAKIGSGIRDAWVMHKVPKQYFDQLLSQREEDNVPIKPVSKAYVNKIAQCFLSETVNAGEVPEPAFIEVAEIFGANQWYPQTISWDEEVTKLIGAKALTWTEDDIQASLQRSGGWHLNRDFALHWFECGEIVEQVVIESTKKHQTDPSESLESVTIDCLMRDHQCLEKWKLIFWVAGLWMQSEKSHSDASDMLVVLHCLQQGFAPRKLPLICNVVNQSVATVIRRIAIG